MDDPWGSPWTADDAHVKLDLPAPPPQVHTPQTPHKLASPWRADDEEEDTWGGWNAAEGAVGADSPGWGRSPGLRPARSGTISRHVSPEPWGRAEISESSPENPEESDDRNNGLVTLDSAISMGENPFSTKMLATNEDVGPAQALTIITDEIEKPTELDVAILGYDHSETEDTITDDAESTTIEPSRATAGPERPEATRQPSKVQELVHMYDGIAKRRDAPGEPLQAGPRIVLVESNGVETEHSADDDHSTDKTQLPAVEIDMSQTLESSNLGEEDSQGPAGENDADYEDAKPRILLEDSVKVVESSNESENGPTLGPGDSLEQNSEARLNSETPDKEPEVAPSRPTEARVPSVPYAYDPRYLDDLFPSTPAPSINPEPVPDTVIDDTFASISERKAWYRISRRGPMRQHNQGNDEDYVRLDWRSSEVRSRTLKFVRRWMEEDSIAGRVVLGRRTGPVGASMFNWDSRAPQVEIGELLGKKSHRRSLSGASKASGGSLTSPSSASFAWSRGNDTAASSGQPSCDEVKSNSLITPPPNAISPVMPSFGWSQQPGNTTAPEGQSRIGAPSRPTQPALPPIVAPPVGPLQSLDSIAMQATKTDLLQSQRIAEAEEEDDDEWGEMVSSPTWPSASLGGTTQASTLDASANAIIADQAPSAVLSQPPGTGLAFHPVHDPSDIRLQGLDTRSAQPRSEINQNKAAIAPSSSLMDAWTTEKPDTSVNEAVPWASAGSIASGPPAESSESNAASTELHLNLTIDEEAVVSRIIAGLPDLAYMLR